MINNVLVTGAKGFIGGHIVDQLLQRKDVKKIKVIDNESAVCTKKFYMVEDPRVEYHNLDICDYENIRPLFEGINYVFHLAAETRIGPCIDNPILACNTNVIGTCNILQLSLNFGIRRVIYSSTASGYGLANKPPLREDMLSDNLNPYATSKLAAEDLCMMYNKLYGLETIALRYFNVFGERMPESGQYAPVVAIFKKQMRENKNLTIVGNGLQMRDFIYVRDVANANIMAAQTSSENCAHIYNVGSGTKVSILEIAKMLNHPYEFIPPRAGEALTSMADISKIKNRIGWHPTVFIREWLQR